MKFVFAREEWRKCCLPAQYFQKPVTLWSSKFGCLKTFVIIMVNGKWLKQYFD